MSNLSPSNRFPLAMLAMLFFAWGFIICFNDVLIPHLKAVFELSYFGAALVQFCFFLAFFFMPIPSSWIISLIGYQNGIVIGLLLTGLGAILFLPAASFLSYGFFLVALFILATGITLLQVTANPYVALLGPQELSSSRLSLAQGVNSLGTTIAPVVGGYLLLYAVGLPGEALTPLEQVSTVKLPYLVIAVGAIALALLFYFIKLPIPLEVSPLKYELGIWRQVLHYRHLTLGVVGVFLYVGAEIAIGTFLINFIMQPHILNISAEEASYYVAIYWGAAMTGRFIGSIVQLRVSPAKTLAIAALAAFMLILGAIFTSGFLALSLLLVLGFFNSIMFPTIFSLSVRDLGSLTGLGSSLLVMAIVGGAVIPLTMGIIADWVGIQGSLVLPACCYVYVAHYAIKGCQSISPSKELKASQTIVSVEI